MTDKPLEHRRREPAPGIFRLVLPLPFPGLSRVNAYLLTGAGGATLVDCGLQYPDGSEVAWDALCGALDAAGCEPSGIDRLIVTHTHIDHYGLAGRLVDEQGCELWMHSAASEELEAYRDPASSAARLRAMLGDHGVGEADLDELTSFEDWRGFVSEVIEPTTPLEGGESLTAGNRPWEIVHTPGHARSHICLWSAEERILISGDHLLPTVTPHIDFKRGAEEDPLGEFLSSLEKVEALDPALTLPGHGRPFEEGAERARVIARHHDRRLGSILQVIRRQPHTANEITDEIFGSALLNFQRRLALGEALAHLAYLRKRGEVERTQRDDGTYVFAKVRRHHAPEDDE
ncbi:MAG: MBL fold metallo-hydrolase [Actinomycetota bacterium]|nr:MBL fold metallo-hydrolase [Actinomycetota bacterium]